MKKILVLAAAAVALATPAFAQQTPPTPEERAAAFDKADANKDGKLDMAEWKTTLGERAAGASDEQLAQFMARRDTDKDGKLSKAEFTAPMQRPAQ